MIIDKLRVRSAGASTALVFAYCRYTDGCTAESILRCFSRQLLERHGQLLPIVKAEYDKQAALMELSEVANLFLSLLHQFHTRQVVVDGLDEISSQERTRLLQVLAQSSAQILVLSRPLDPYLPHLPRAVPLPIDNRNRGDITNFVVSKLEARLGVKAMVGNMKKAVQEIASVLEKKAGGM